MKKTPRPRKLRLNTGATAVKQAHATQDTQADMPDSPGAPRNPPAPEVPRAPPAGTPCPADAKSGATEAACGEAQTPEPGLQISPAKLSGQQTWHAQYEAVVGLAHRNASPPMPCQDAAISRSQPHPTLILADGAGSAAMAEMGAQAVVRGLARVLHTLDKQVADLLDGSVATEAACDHSLNARHFALLLVKHAKGILDDLAEQQRRSARDFRCTLLLIVTGRERALWLKVGDGALVLERRHRLADGKLQPELYTLGAPGKGEFANITQFVDDQLSPADVQSGLLDMQDISGLAAMSDGAAEKLIAQDSSRVARQLEYWLEAMRQGKLTRRELTRSFYSDAFCSGSSGDDCSIALLASEVITAPLPAGG